MRDSNEKIVDWTEVEEVAARVRAAGQRVVTTNGCFDLLHLGHLKTLQEARRLGDRLWVAVNSDASVKTLKGPRRPIQGQKTRALQLAALEAVDFVTVFSQSTPIEFLQKVGPAIHVKGGDYDPAALPERLTVENGGGKVVCLPYTPGFSTTELIERIKTD